MSAIAPNLAAVRERIAAAARRAGRRPEEVRLVAVAKTFPIEAIREAYAAGQRDFGENKVQEALQKMDAGADMQIAWHLIGHLQSNKARKAAEQCAVVHSVDSVDLLKRLDAAAAAAGRTIDVLVQADLALEATKHGAPIDTLPAIFAEAPRCASARVVGPVLLGPGASVLADATLVGPASLGAECTVEKGALVSRSVAWNRCVVGRSAVVDGCVLTDGAVVGAGESLFHALKVQSPGRRPAEAGRVPAPARGNALRAAMEMIDRALS